MLRHIIILPSSVQHDGFYLLSKLGTLVTHRTPVSEALKTEQDEGREEAEEGEPVGDCGKEE